MDSTIPWAGVRDWVIPSDIISHKFPVRFVSFFFLFSLLSSLRTYVWTESNLSQCLLTKLHSYRKHKNFLHVFQRDKHINHGNNWAHNTRSSEEMITLEWVILKFLFSSKVHYSTTAGKKISFMSGHPATYWAHLTDKNLLYKEVDVK